MFPILNETLKKVRLSQTYNIGDHFTSSLEVGDALPVASRDYDTRLGDTPFDIDPFDIFANPRQVTLSVARSPLNINIFSADTRAVTQSYVSGKQYLDNLERARTDLAGRLADIISSLKTGSIGRSRVYSQADYSYAQNNPSFVIDNSLFETFNPDNIRTSLKKYIGIRVLHQLEINVPADIGIFQTGLRELPHLDTSKKRDLNNFNQNLIMKDEKRKLQILERWKTAGGIALVDVVYSPMRDIDFSSLDEKLSLVVTQEWL